MDELNLDGIKLVESNEQDQFELPHCLVCVDYHQKVHLVQIFNEDQVDSFWTSSEFTDYLDEEEWDCEPGLYTADFSIHSWQDNTPDSCDWNSELETANVEPYIG